ncbi:protein-S-isoprenylcysteine O-methyltransferase [Fischerella sp. JS2]|uniref:protein-S-isoprenylcysteine O-methyltransferase n=1 Tax=Fischerella sp. JS2 TaxID=2597771 RepID=UPI0028EE3D03|nr:protein-S-isoprenylcysteine O-methyltransferase [Fischerella sp. JS2]
MSEATCKAAFLLGFLTVLVIRIYFAQQVKSSKVKDDRKTIPEILLLLLSVLGMFLLPLVGVFTPWLKFADYDLPGWTGWVGTVAFGLAIWIFWRAHIDLGLNWSASLEIRENHSLVDTGVYQYIRHPMYAAFWLWGIAQVLLLHNWIYGLSYLVSFVPMYFLRIHLEEQMMIDTFGKQYQEYMTRTGRVIPKLSQIAG